MIHTRVNLSVVRVNVLWGQKRDISVPKRTSSMSVSVDGCEPISCVCLHGVLNCICDCVCRNGEAKAMKRVSVIGKLCAISEPLRNGPDFMIIVRIADLAATSVYRHIIIQVVTSCVFSGLRVFVLTSL